VIGEHGSAIKISCERVRSSERVREETASPGWMVQAIKTRVEKCLSRPSELAMMFLSLFRFALMF